MADNLSFEIPRDVRNFSHDFRIAIFSFLRPFKDIATFNYDDASIVLTPQGVTSISFSCSVGSSPAQGSFSLYGGLVGDLDKVPLPANSSIGASIVTTDSDGNVVASTQTFDPLSNKLTGDPVDLFGAENRPMDIGSMFANVRQLIKPMDYIWIFTKDVRTNLWYGQEAPDDKRKPKFIGIITDISTNYNAALNQIVYTVNFKTMLRLLEVARYSLNLSLIDAAQRITGKDFGSVQRNIILDQVNLGTKDRPHEALLQFVAPDYPSELVGSRIEADQMRAEAQSPNYENYAISSIQARTNYETKLNKLRAWASNKDFEFYAAEDGQLVWKVPTYARGINKKTENKATTKVFNPYNYDLDTRDTIYHLSDIISVNINQSETEMLNIVTAASNAVNGFGSNQSQNDMLLKYLYFIQGGANVEPGFESDRRFGFEDIGIRSMMMDNPLYYNAWNNKAKVYGVDVSTDIRLAQLMFIDSKVYKNNIGKYWTGSLTMVDDPRIQCGMPCIVPLLARAGVNDQKGKILPAIFYIAGTNRKYEYGKHPLLTLSLTHGRLASEEFHNGVHIFHSISSWWARTEPELFWDLYSTDDVTNDLTPLVSTNTITTTRIGVDGTREEVVSEAPPSDGSLLYFTSNDERINQITKINYEIGKIQ